MKLYFAVLAIWISALTLPAAGIGNNVYKFKQDPKDMGKMANCGTAEGGSDFKFSWSPRVITPNKKYTISFSGKASVGFDHGKANATVWIVGYGQPIFTKEVDATCDEAVPMAKGLLKCPVKAGSQIGDPSYTITAPPSISQVPPGDYTVMLQLRNENGKLFICAKGDVTFSG